MAKSRNAVVLLSFIVLLQDPARGTTQAFFSSQESVEKDLSRLIDESRSSIEIALFELRSLALVRTLKRAEDRGVKVRLVLDTAHRADDLPAGEIRWLGGKAPRGRGVMHNKFALFDKARVVTGSYNWTPGAEYSNYENALLTDDPKTVKAYAEEFETLWQRAEPGLLPLLPHHSPSPIGRGRLKGRVRQSRLKTIKIKVPKPVIKHRPKTHTIRP